MPQQKVVKIENKAMADRVTFRAEVTTLASVLPQERSLVQTHKMADGDSEEIAIRDYFIKGVYL